MSGVCLLLGITNGCVTVTHTDRELTETVKFVKDDEISRIVPIITVRSAPSVRAPRLILNLTQKLFGPLYEVEIYRETSREKEHAPLLVPLFLVGGMFLLCPFQDDAGQCARTAFTGELRGTKGSSSETVKGTPRKIQDVGEFERPWRRGTVDVIVGGRMIQKAEADEAGTVSWDIEEVVPHLSGTPGAPITVTIRAAAGSERTSEQVTLDQELSRFLWGKATESSERSN